MQKRRYARKAVPAQRLNDAVLKEIRPMTLAEAWKRIAPICGRWHSAGRRNTISGSRDSGRTNQLLANFALIVAEFPHTTVGGLAERHMECVAKHNWTRIKKGLLNRDDPDALSHGSWDNYKASLDFFLKVIRRGDLLRPMTTYVPKEEWRLLGRMRACTDDLSPAAAGILDVTNWIRINIKPIDRLVADCFYVADQFGLRKYETCWVVMDCDVVERDGARFLTVREEGSKTGRERFVDIETPEQEALVVRLQQDYGGKVGVRLGARSRNVSPRQIYAKIDRICRRVGLTKADLGAVFHCFRHGYVHRVFKAATGVEVAVKGGDPRTISRENLNKALDKIARVTGHSRYEICTAYGVFKPRSPFLEYVLEKARGGDFGPDSPQAARRVHELLMRGMKPRGSGPAQRAPAEHSEESHE